ncbi:hypothetical protein ETB97_001830, partial [Aspergillus alliaceus]
MSSHDSHIYTLHERPKLVESTSSHGPNFVSLIITVPKVSAPLVCHCRTCGRSGGGSSINYVLPEADVTFKDPHSSLKAYEDTNTVSGNRIQKPTTRLQHHIFRADASGSNNSSGAAAAYKTPASGDKWLDGGYAISDLCDGKWVELPELFAIGAVLRIALSRIGKRVVGCGEEHVVSVISGSMVAKGLLCA